MNFSTLSRGNPKNPALLFIHGFMGQKEDWLPIIEVLQESFLCLSIDLPGHGKTPLGDYQNFSEVTQDLLYFVKTQLEGKKVFLLGYSLGGRLSLDMALNSPQYFSGMILESCNPGIESKIERQQRYQNDLGLLSYVTSLEEKQEFLKNWFEMPLFGDIKTHPLYPKLLESRLEGNFSSWGRSLKFLSIGTQQNLWEDLPLLEIPCLYLSGDKDEKYTEIGEKMKKLSSNLRHHRIPNSAHNIHMEQNKAFLSQLLTFLKI